MVISSDSDSDGKSSATCIPSDEVQLAKAVPVPAVQLGNASNPLSSGYTPVHESHFKVGNLPKARGELNEFDEGLNVVEVCCGCARLTHHCSKVGLRSLGVDWAGCKDKPEGRVIWINLATSHGRAELLQRLEANRETLRLVFMSPPCGTASRAREIRRRKPDLFGRVIDPMPLRSDEHPDGIPTLGGKALVKVEIANALYANMVEIALWCDKHEVAWVIENPSNSHMWETEAFRSLRKLKWDNKVVTPYVRSQYQNCMHGGDRPKKTTLMNARVDLSELEIMCDNKCVHKPWGLLRDGSAFATAEERRYPALLCSRLAKIFAKVAGVKRKRSNLEPSEAIASNKQPRRGQPELVPVSLTTEEVFVDGGQVGSPVVLDAAGVPTSYTVGEEVLSPMQFLQNARDLTHPFDRPVRLSPTTARSICKLASLGPTQVTELRKSTIGWYRQRAEQLSVAESALHSKLSSRVETVVKDKRVLLFKEMLSDINYDDMGVVDLLTMGVKVVGTLPKIGIWRPDDRRAKITVKAALHGAADAKKELRRNTPGKWSDIDQALVDCTYKEVEDGHLLGPFTEADIDKRLGSRVWLPARRFPIQQGQKLRPIDDFSENGHNAAFGASEKVSLKSLDTVVAVSRALLESPSDDGSVIVHDTAGRQWRASLSEEWSRESFTDLVGRVADLKGAYKQLACHPAHRCFSIIALPKRSGAVEYFEALSLMFGQTAAVYGFLRFSRALSALSSELLLSACVEFFDDFSQIEPVQTSESAHSSFEDLLQLLGWEISFGDKRLPFAKSFVSLGVLVKLPDAGGSNIELRNKPGRVEAIKAEAEKVLEVSKPFGFKDALSFKGKFGFAEGQTFGRVLAPVSRVLSAWASERRPRMPSELLKLALSHAVIHLETAGPRVIGPRRKEKPVLIFTDGACEPEGTTVGGVLVDGPVAQCFGCVVSAPQVEAWKTKLNQKQVIGQAELFPVLLAKLTWAEHLRDRRAIYFIDNDAARLGLVKAYSPVLPSLGIIMDCLNWDYANSAESWYARVPSASNISDGPSRLDFELVYDELKATRVVPKFPS